jgi:predicted dehydrogenase
VYHVRRALFNFARRDDWQSLRRYGGGMLNNYGAHAIDQVLQLIGYDIRRVFCNLRLVASLGDADEGFVPLERLAAALDAEPDVYEITVVPRW